MMIIPAGGNNRRIDRFEAIEVALNLRKKIAPAVRSLAQDAWTILARPVVMLEDCRWDPDSEPVCQPCGQKRGAVRCPDGRRELCNKDVSSFSPFQGNSPKLKGDRALSAIAKLLLAVFATRCGDEIAAR